MNTKTTADNVPKRLLLATDMSARCDRALDRAAQLATQWHAELLTLNILESSQAPDMALTWAYGDESSNLQIAQRQLKQDLAGLQVQLATRIAYGDVASAIQTAALEDECDLIVTGMARNETFGRFLLGSSVEKLARMVVKPLLVVRSRPHGPYHRVLVATDFSESSRHALYAALRLFPAAELTIYHAHNMPLSVKADEKPSVKLDSLAIHQEYNRFIDACDFPAGIRQRLHFVVEYGALESALTHYVRAKSVDLVVIGTHGHSGIMSVLLGSTAARLLDWLPCDTMIIRDPRAII